MKFSYKSLKKFVYDYKYIIALLLILIFIYRYLNIHIIENLESKTSALRNFQPTIKNTSDFDINVEVYAVGYDTRKKVNTISTVIQSTTLKALGELKVTKYAKSGNVGFAVKLSTTDNSEKNIKAEIAVCSEQRAGAKKICSIFKPNIANYIELKDYNFKVLHDKNDVSITSPNTDKKWLIHAVKPYSFFSIGFKFL
jgi:hypothetical protein